MTFKTNLVFFETNSLLYRIDSWSEELWHLEVDNFFCADPTGRRPDWQVRSSFHLFPIFQHFHFSSIFGQLNIILCRLMTENSQLWLKLLWLKNSPLRLKNSLPCLLWLKNSFMWLKNTVYCRVCNGFRLTKRDDYFWADLTTFKLSLIFWGSWGSIENWHEPETEPPLGNLAWPNVWNTLYD